MKLKGEPARNYLTPEARKLLEQEVKKSVKAYLDCVSRARNEKEKQECEKLPHA
ncbi:cag pathogenicity island protein [Helicobacter pylori 908]|nr:cag pathogenicity island protein [Helicobacter pylori 908]